MDEDKDGLRSVSLVNKVVIELIALILHGVFVGIGHGSDFSLVLQLRGGDQLGKVLTSLVLLDTLKQFFVSLMKSANHLV